MSRTAISPDSLPAENGVHVFRAAVVMPPITAAFVALRFYSRLYVLRRRMALDDCASRAFLDFLDFVPFRSLSCSQLEP